jgi:ribonuclease HII
MRGAGSFLENLMACTLEYERAHWLAGARWVAGVDEVGRGCLAGPVVAAAVVLPLDFCHPILNDSKKLTPARRERIFGELLADARVLIGIGSADVEEIDRLNILRASHLAMERAVRALPERPCALLVDGLPMVPFPFDHQAIVGGDALSLSIAAASVMAKVTRDRLMTAADQQFPGYGFDRHKGYGTTAHLVALASLGVTPLHRRSFAPVRQLTLAL